MSPLPETINEGQACTALAPMQDVTTWEFMKDNWKEFDRRYGGGGFAVMRLVSITGAFNTAEDAIDVKEFFNANPVPAATRTVEQSLERINLNSKWLDFNIAALSEWFD